MPPLSSPVKMETRTLFGTDGIRGMAGNFPLDRKTTRTIGRALGHYLARTHKNPQVVIGEDTRESSRGIAECVAAGLAEASVRVESAGVITTPGIAYLARTRNFAAGVVISASHNPWTDNGIKIFGHDGYKLPDSAELEIESEIFGLIREANGDATTPPALKDAHRLHESYVAWLAERWDRSGAHKSKLKVVADCANGAASAIAPELFAACGIDASFTCHKPDGKNINENCGALHPENVGHEVVARSANAGVTFDGDADRCLFADAHGKVINGDGVLLLTARHMKRAGTLKGDLIVATTMSNMGLEAALRTSGIKMLRAPVGDKYVLEEMNKSGAALGGEQSGHIIFRDRDSTTGDGLLTALRVLKIMAESGKPLDELVADLKVFPQIIRNVRVREKKPLELVPEVARAIQSAQADLNGTGRVVVRYSGTEALARVMVEAASAEKMTQHAEAIAEAIHTALGA
jgi:phosphoglucosamine mutase